MCVFLRRLWPLLLSLLCALPAAGADSLHVALQDFEAGNAPALGGETVSGKSHLTLSREQAHSGRQSARLTYHFEKNVSGRQYVTAELDMPLGGAVEAVCAWIYGDGSNQPLYVRLTDTSGEWFQFAGGVLDWKGWREVSFPLKNPISHWGGDNNGRLEAPLQWKNLILDSTAARPYDSVVYLDDLSYIATGRAVDFIRMSVSSPAPGNVFFGGQKPRLTVHARNLLSNAAQNVELELTTLDTDGSSTVEKRQLTLPVRSEQSLSCTPRVRGYGLKRLHFRCRAGADTQDGEITFACLPSAGASKLDDQSPFGACTHFGQGKGILPLNLSLLSGMGGRWLRDEFSWDSIEVKKGQYTFPAAFDAAVKAAPRYGIEPFLIFDYGNGLYDNGQSPSSREAISAFADYVYQIVSRYKPYCHYWEVFNEPNVGFWKPTPDPKAYARLLRASYAAAKRADPHCTVVGICTAGTDLKFIEAVLKEGGIHYLDAVSIHPYRYPRSPEASDFIGELTRCKELINQYGGKDKPLWLTEIGWPTQNDRLGVSEAVSGNYLVRMYVQALSLPFVKRIFWYDFQNDGLDASYNEHNFGLIRKDFSPKENYVAYRMMTAALAGKRFARRLPLPEPQYAYEFSDGKERTVVAWSAQGSSSTALRLQANSVQISDARGALFRQTVKDGVLPVQLTEAPIFITGRFPSPGISAPVIESSGAATAYPGEKTRFSVTVRNPWKQALSPSVRVEAPAGWRIVLAAGDSMIAPGGQMKLTLEVQTSEDAECRSYPLPVVLLDARGRRLGSGAAEVKVVNPLQITLAPTLADQRPVLRLSLRNSFNRPLPALKATVSLPQGGIQDAAVAIPALAAGATYQRDLPVSGLPASAEAQQPVTVAVSFPAGANLRSEYNVNFWRVPRLPAITVDGDLAEWRDVPATPITRFYALRDNSRKDHGDQDADIRLAYTPEALFLAVDVNDDRFVQPYDADAVWQGDNIQVAFDPNPAARAQSTDANLPYTEAGLTLTGHGPEVYRWQPTAGLVPGIKLAVTRQGTHTRYEAAFPWKLLGATPEPGRLLGFSLLVNENDGEGRDGWLEMFKGIGLSKDPLQFGQITLE